MQPRSNSQLFKVSLDHTLSNQSVTSSYLLSKYQLNLNEEWISTSKLISCLYEIERRVGASTLNRVGVNIALSAANPRKDVVDFTTFFTKELNQVYQYNHIALENGFDVYKNGEHDFFVDLGNNPYPVTFNKGLLSGFCFKHHTLCTVDEVEKNVLQVKKVM